MRKAIVSFFTAIALVLTLLGTMQVSATPSPDIWGSEIIGVDMYPFGGGDGSSASQAYEISTPEQLAQLAYDANHGNVYSGKYFTLTADLDLSGRNWTKIGNGYYNGFDGTFDGNGHKIDGLTITRSQSDTTYGDGLFGVVSSNGVIKNLTIESGLITQEGVPGYDVIFGGITGYNYGTIINCVNKATIRAEVDNVWVYGGGMAGMSDWSASFINCRNEGDITIGNLGFAGGIIGYHLNGGANTRYENCHNSGNISGTDFAVIGGIGGKIGYLDANVGAGIFNCSNRGDLITGSVDNIYSNQFYIGGLVGDLYGGPVINSFNTGDVTALYNPATSSEPLFAGGLIGYTNYTTIRNAYNAGIVDGPAGRAGSILGANSSTFPYNSQYENIYFLDSSSASSGSSPGTALT